MRTSTAKVALFLGLTTSALLACGGRTLGQCPGGATECGVQTGDPDASDDAGACVYVDLSTYRTGCATDSDCTTITAGEVCTGSCSCGGSAVNIGEEARYESETAGIQQGDCFCPSVPAPQCLESVCSICTGSASDPPSCATLDTPDASACVYIDLSDYPTGCVFDSDCTTITSGEICSGGCACGGSAINVSGETEYDDAIQSLSVEGCPCAFSGEPRCIQSTCTICDGGPNQPAGCDIEDAGSGGD
jgi:hypothetical protein